MKNWSTIFLLAILFTGCNSSVQNSMNNHETNTKRVLNQEGEIVTGFEILKSAVYPISTQGKKETSVYRSDDAHDVEAFQEAYIALTNEIAPDFEGTIIIAKMGEKRSGGYSIEVENVKDIGDYTEVTFISKSPSGIATMALTNPYVVVYLPNNYKNMVIIDK